MDCTNGTLLVTGIWALVIVKLLEIWYMFSEDE